MELKLDDLDLMYRSQADTTGPVSELRTAYNIRTLDHRSLVELRIPGAKGGLMQDLGREPVRIHFNGMMSGPDAKTSLDKLQDKFKARTPLSFTTDITAVGEIDEVLIEYLEFEEVSGEVDRYTYLITLREHKEPTEPGEEGAPSQEREAQEEVQKESEFWDIEGRVLDKDGEPARELDIIISGPAEYRVTLTEEDDGYYRVRNVPEGKYTVTVDAPGYEDLKAEFHVKKGGNETGEEGEEAGVES